MAGSAHDHDSDRNGLPEVRSKSEGGDRMAGGQVPDGTVVHAAWMIHTTWCGAVRRWGAVVLTVPGEDEARAHICWDEPGHGLRAARCRGEALKLVEKTQAKALKMSAILGDAPIRRCGGGPIEQFRAWFRGTDGDIPTPQFDDSWQDFE